MRISNVICMFDSTAVIIAAVLGFGVLEKVAQILLSVRLSRAIKPLHGYPIAPVFPH